MDNNRAIKSEKELLRLANSLLSVEDYYPLLDILENVDKSLLKTARRIKKRIPNDVIKRYEHERKMLEGFNSVSILYLN